MKRIISFFITISLISHVLAADKPVINTPLETNPVLPECCATVTNNGTVNGETCEGAPFSVTSYKTATRCDLGGNCYNAFRAAQNAAKVEAIIHATIAVAVITAECDGQQEP